MHRGAAAAGIRIVEARQVVMHQGCTMQQLDRGGGRIGHTGPVLAAGGRHRQAQPRADACAAGKYGIVHGRMQPGGTARMVALGKSGGQRVLDP